MRCEISTACAITAQPTRAGQGVRCVVIVPVYNHAAGVIGVVSRIAELGHELIVVNDGSTDSTAERLEGWFSGNGSPRAELITHTSNLGKAAALRTGFERARLRGASHAVTIDADGQLDPDDIARMLDEATRHPGALILGRRPEKMEHCPGRCTVGRRNASLAVLAQTGSRLADTQCGLRVYPLDLIARIGCRAERYAFEAEAITRALWAGAEVREVPVSCRYFAGDERVSHWKPWRDSISQGALHLRLVAVALVFGSPAPALPGSCSARRGRIGALLHWLNPMRSWREVRSEPIGDLELASGLAIGAWIGTLPCFGLHTLLSVLVARRLHQQPAAVVLGSQVSTPPLGVALAAMSIGVGHFLLTGTLMRVDPATLTWASAWQIPIAAFAKWMLGSVFVATAVAVITYVIGLWIARRIRAGFNVAPERGEG